jgi:hypothetical protein
MLAFGHAAVGAPGCDKVGEDDWVREQARRQMEEKAEPYRHIFYFEALRRRGPGGYDPCIPD